MDLAAPGWFGDPAAPLLGWWHLPADHRPRAWVVVCPSLSQEHHGGYRTLRMLADELSGVGVGVLRFDYPGTGDSGGSSWQRDLVRQWQSSIATAVTSARTVADVPVALLGVRVGATLVAQVARDVDPAAVVMWDPVVSAERWLRHQQALHRLDGAARPSDGVEIPGLALHPDAAADLRLLTITADILRARVPTLAVTSRDDAAAAPFADGGVEMVRADYPGSFLEVEPNLVAVPVTTITRIASWLAKTLPLAGSAVPAVAPDAAAAIAVDDGVLHETATVVGPMRTSGVVTAPARPRGVTAVFVGTTTTHRVGPGRMWVDLSRQWAGRGITCARVDIGGTGDGAADRDQVALQYYTDVAVEETVAAVRALEVDPGDRLVLVGLCAGAWTAMRAARPLHADAAYLVNQLVWDRAAPNLALDVDGQIEALPVRSRRAAVRRLLPRWSARALDSLGVTNSPLARLGELARGGVAATLVLGPEENRGLQALLGERAVPAGVNLPGRTRWRRRAPVGQMVIADLDHALLHAAARTAIAERLGAELDRWASDYVVATSRRVDVQGRLPDDPRGRSRI